MKRKIKARKLLRVFLCAVVCLACGFGLYTWNATVLAGNQMPMPFGVGVGVVMSGSMEPTLSVDDVIVVRRASSYEVGDVVVFQQHGILVVHEVIAVEGNTLTTKGSANTVADEPISLGDIKGEVWFHLEGLGGVISWLRSPFGTLSILLLAGALLAFSYNAESREGQRRKQEVEDLKREIERMKQEDLDAQAGDGEEEDTPKNE